VASDPDFHLCVGLLSISETVLLGSHIAAVSEGGMTIKLHRQSLVAYGAPLVETIVDCPPPQGTEVLVRIERCGVCHSDLHMQDGYFRLAGDKKLDITSGRALPFTLGHEIAGVIESAGADVKDDAAAAPGRKVAVYPWIGCGACPACRQGEENLCAAPRHLGITADGGYASHVLVPHLRYLLDYAPLSPALAGLLMCSGLTAYAALMRLKAHAARGPVLLVGLGGVGMMGMALARTLFATAPLVADIDAGKREAALKAGAAAAFDPADPTARKAVTAKTGGVHGVCDFVGSESSLAFATGVLAKGGKVVVTGLIGGGWATPVAMFVLRAMTIEGVLTGTLAEAEELMALARAGHAPAVPFAERPLGEAQAALDDLRAGRVVGRAVLRTDDG
jgi:D-arabinose 1-dehydrogenase-like Zn-dependent alcohol dehydrogenase